VQFTPHIWECFDTWHSLCKTITLYQKSSGNLHVHGEVFARKRQKLQQCVADALFTDTEKLCSKGLGTVLILILIVLALYHECNRNFSGTILFPGSSVGCSLWALRQMYVVLAISQVIKSSSDLHSLTKVIFYARNMWIHIQEN